MNTNTHKVTVGKVVQYLILILMFLLLVGPFVWELSLSFKGKGDNVYAVPPYLMPKTPTLENYISVFKQVPVFHYMLNTLVVCLTLIFGNVVFSTMAGYALGRLKWRGRGLVFTMFMGTMVIPIEGVMISQFLIIRSIHLQNTLLAVALPGLCGAINILLMTNAFKSPHEVQMPVSSSEFSVCNDVESQPFLLCNYFCDCLINNSITFFFCDLSFTVICFCLFYFLWS